MLRRMFVWSLSLALAAVAALAETKDQSKSLKEMQKQATRLDAAAAGQSQETVFNLLSQQLSIPVETLRAQQTSTNLAPGQLFIANSLAAASGKTFDQIAEEFKSGKGWGQIANESDLNLGKVVSDLKRANKQVEEDRMEQARANERANEHRSNPGYSNENSGPGAHDTGPATQQQGAAAGRGGAQAGSRGRR